MAEGCALGNFTGASSGSVGSVAGRCGVGYASTELRNCSPRPVADQASGQSRDVECSPFWIGWPVIAIVIATAYDWTHRAVAFSFTERILSLQRCLPTRCARGRVVTNPIEVRFGLHQLRPAKQLGSELLSQLWRVLGRGSVAYPRFDPANAGRARWRPLAGRPSGSCYIAGRRGGLSGGGGRGRPRQIIRTLRQRGNDLGQCPSHRDRHFGLGVVSGAETLPGVAPRPRVVAGWLSKRQDGHHDSGCATGQPWGHQLIWLRDRASWSRHSGSTPAHPRHRLSRSCRRANFSGPGDIDTIDRGDIFPRVYFRWSGAAFGVSLGDYCQRGSVCCISSGHRLVDSHIHHRLVAGMALLQDWVALALRCCPCRAKRPGGGCSSVLGLDISAMVFSYTAVEALKYLA